MSREKATLIYDGACPLCSNAATWIQRNEKEKNSFDMVPCQSGELEKLFPAVNRAACMREMHLVLPNGAVLKGHKSLPEIAKRLRRFSSLHLLWKLPGFDLISRIFYRCVAATRYFLSGFLRHS